MILDIKTYPNKILTKKTKRVGEFDAATKKLIDDMVETLYAKKGAGLAANQIGVSKQIIVVDDSRGEGNVKVLINPKIISKKGAVIMVEGCLSFPGLELEIKRPEKIEVEFSDKRGQAQKIKASELLARIICHEVDHLEGKTMLDRLPLLKRLKLKRQLREE
ncbi:MAG: Peptide deformylase [Parcubacteria group bacterium GW2011_GWA2_43_9b]|uniref:Peptide deformylase n=1 Tax=Candidatus Portnoybacteria bacterium RIFCSPLOWO2_02_FULL_39_11 TaxID=1802001 RepID=A0A1G2FPB5_9BACT|nr:MAG: Peptide deformylase [Parcubacteria group bacterium GW2011_GWA2_43_9b]OGZ39667.1 MAG: peptide deformylase [Candidatus Portnoybacteria bacterium RIFCSPLOWO2_02_FULL_39_11]